MNKNNETIENIKVKVKEELKLKEYNKPEITQFGAMQRYTLGGSPGTGDSGHPLSENMP